MTLTAPPPLTRVHRKRAAFIEDVTWMATTGETMPGAAARFGISERALERRLERYCEPTVLHRLLDNGQSHAIEFGAALIGGTDRIPHGRRIS